jgi:DNA-binding IclR family transcriptional regulator
VHRILDQLVQVRWLAREQNSYRLGMSMLRLGGLAVQQDGLHSRALPLMHELSTVTGLVVHLSVLDGTEVVHLDRVGNRPGYDPASRVGGRLPAHCTALGKALLAYTDDAVTEAVVEAGLRARTRYTITRRESLERELQHVRERGIATDREETLPGTGCVAAPVRGPGPAIAAISVSGPMRELDIPRLGPLVRQRAATLWQSVNAGGPGPRGLPSASPAPAASLGSLTTWRHLTGWL